MGLFSGLFGLAGATAEAAGDVAEGDAYGTGAKYAGQNAVISGEAGAIKLEQANRQIFKTLGAQRAGYAGAGLAGSGSAQYVLRDSTAQAGLERAIVNEQTQINVTGYKEQQSQFEGMQQKAYAAAGAAEAKGVGDFLSVFGF